MHSLGIIPPHIFRMDMLGKTTFADLHDGAKKRKTPWTTRMHNFIQSPSTTNKLRKSSNETSQLGQSLQTLLSRGRKGFRDFLKTEFCEENLDFWLACEEFKTISSPEMLSWRATSIYEAFVRTGSPKEINLDFHTRESLAQNLLQQQPSPFCFTAAQNKIYSMMENDAFPRFVQSDLYKDLSHSAGSRPAPAGLGNRRNAFRAKNKGGPIIRLQINQPPPSLSPQ